MHRSLPLLLALAASCGGGDDDGGGGDPDAAPTSTTLVVEVTDGPGGAGLPAKVVLTDAAGEVLHIGTLDMYNGNDQDRGSCDLGGGAVGSWDGILLPDGSGEIPVGHDDCIPGPAVPFGTYGLTVMRGIEYEMFHTTVDLSDRRGRVVIKAALARAWAPEGALAADLHVHSLGSGDSTMPRAVRVISELVAGIQVVGTSDHNLNGTLEDSIDELGLRGQIAALRGNEASADLIHANVFPATIEPGKTGNGAPTYTELRQLSAAQFFARLRALPGSPLIQLNHPRLRFAAYYDYVGWNGRAWPPPMPIDFDAVEVLNGMSAFNKPDWMAIDDSVQDLYTLVDHGYLVTAMGNSDTHHLSSVLAGIPRNYVRADDLRLDPFDELGFIDALRQRRVLVTTGPWLDVRAGAPAAGRVALSLKLRQATFVHATRIQVVVGGELRDTLAVPPGATSFEWSGDEAVGAVDTWIGVVAIGDDPLPAVLHGTPMYKAAMPPFAMINPILVDADLDGRFSRGAGKPLAARDVPPPPSDGTEPPDCRPPW